MWPSPQVPRRRCRRPRAPLLGPCSTPTPSWQVARDNGPLPRLGRASELCLLLARCSVVPPPGYYGAATSPGWDQQALAANFSTMTLQQPQQREWYFDSSATTHVLRCRYPHSFLSSAAFTSFIYCLGNGDLLPVTSTGSTDLSPHLHLNYVLVSPGLIKNLISVHQFTSDNNCSVEFDHLGCSVKDLPS